MERGILFSKTGKGTVESQKRFSFADVAASASWDKEEQTEVSREDALRFDAFSRDMLKRY